MNRIFVLCLMAACFVLVGCQEESSDLGATNVVRDSVLSSDSVMIYYEACGQGDKAVVFVHGWSCDGSYWARQVEALKDEYRVVTVDLAGHGKSGSGRKNWTIDLFGDDVAAVVNALALNKVALVGHSMGGAVCIEAARRLPDQVLFLVGVDTYQNLWQMPPPQEVEAFVEPFRVDFAGRTRKFVANIFGPNADSTLVSQVTDDMVDTDPLIAVALFETYSAYDAASALKEMRKPIRAINSDMWETDVEGNRKVAESFEVVIMPGVGHFLQLEAPAKFNLTLKETLQEFWPSR